MEGINQRVMELMMHLGLSKSAFAQSIQVSAPVITHISSGRNKVGLDVAQKILQAYPQINTDWLILGKGEMISTDNYRRIEDLKDRIEQIDGHLRNVLKDVHITQNEIIGLKDLL